MVHAAAGFARMNKPAGPRLYRVDRAGLDQHGHRCGRRDH
jgi:hypothetical protein